MTIKGARVASAVHDHFFTNIEQPDSQINLSVSDFLSKYLSVVTMLSSLQLLLCLFTYQLVAGAREVGMTVKHLSDLDHVRTLNVSNVAYKAPSGILRC